LPGLREKLTWFALGAVSAGAIVALVVRQSAAVGVTAPDTSAEERVELSQQLQRIEQRLAAIERRGQAPVNPAAAGTTARPAMDPSPAPARSAAPDQEQQRAAESGSIIVQRAVGSGSWSRQDATDFLVATAHMRAEDRAELTRQLTMAINEDRLRVEPGAELIH